MRILYICSDFPSPNKGSNLYTDLAEELLKQGHELQIIVPTEKKILEHSKEVIERKIPVLRVTQSMISIANKSANEPAGLLSLPVKNATNSPSSVQMT